MGDVLLCTPAIRQARRALPAAQIVFITETAGGEVLVRNPDLDEVWITGGGWTSRLQLLRRVARGRFDAVVDFRSTGSTAQLTLASGASRKIGIRGRGPRNRVYTELVERLEPPQYAARHKLEMLALLGIEIPAEPDLSLVLPIGAPARRFAERVWQERGLLGEQVVAITPASRESYKQWGTEKWAAAADRIAATGARVLLTHGPGEIEQVRAVVGAMRQTPEWGIEAASIEEFTAILERCTFWLGNDGGAKHLAAAAGLPTLAITRWQIGPVWTDAGAWPRQKFIDRAPPNGCDMKCPSCAHRSCLNTLSVEEVLAEALPGISERTA